ncbi:hypothetical protein RFI_10693 [Reticulomyxa filosa]|uniref:Uncharacterized protein n=1 Tax=Reticulomyxa filosa TaxID=46433 RepID=X6NJH1_RETFI|nr:hypothetical protein RFI_10693 [Reticulomyxa filosa]|eukprot:ETO26445.1 hypothetical protein RFI_10693 [Reticulomyxa filosa]
MQYYHLLTEEMKQNDLEEKCKQKLKIPTYSIVRIQSDREVLGTCDFIKYNHRTKKNEFDLQLYKQQCHDHGISLFDGCRHFTTTIYHHHTLDLQHLYFDFVLKHSTLLYSHFCHLIQCQLNRFSQQSFFIGKEMVDYLESVMPSTPAVNQIFQAARLLDYLRCYVVVDSMETLLGVFDHLYAISNESSTSDARKTDTNKNPSSLPQCRICHVENNLLSYKPVYKPPAKLLTKEELQRKAQEEEALNETTGERKQSAGAFINSRSDTAKKEKKKKKKKSEKIRVKRKKDIIREQLEKELPPNSNACHGDHYNSRVIRPDFATNLRYVSVYVIVSSPSPTLAKHVRLIAEVRLVLKNLNDHFERYVRCVECFNNVLNEKKLFNAFKAFERQKRSNLTNKHLEWFWREEILPRTSIA